MKTKVHQDVYIGIGFILLNIFFFVMSRGLSEGAEVFPRILLILMILLSVFIIGDGLKKTKEMESGAKKYESFFLLKEMEPALKAFLVVFIYVVLFYLVGFFIATALFLVLFMRYLGAENKKTILLTTAIFLLIMYFVFAKQLNVPITGFGKLRNLL